MSGSRFAPKEGDAMDPTAKLLFDYLRDIIYNPDGASLNPEELPEDFRELGKGLQYFAACFRETSALARALAKGDLGGTLPSPENEMAAPLKGLHAAMRHLTWQARQIARGDYRQRVDFMGEIGGAFNTMAERLDRQRAALLKEIESGRRKAEALEQSNRLLQTIMDQISQGVIVVDGATFELLYRNQAAVDTLKHRVSGAGIRGWMEREIKNLPEDGARPHVAELNIQGRGGPLYYSVEIRPLNWLGHGAFAFVFADVSSEREHLLGLQFDAYTDAMTQLFNRRYGMKVLSEWLADGRAFVLCFVDIDNLKYVNDEFGHPEGDKYIAEVTDTLRGFSRATVLCRMGGDEFMLLVQGWNAENAGARLEVLRKKLTNHRRLEDRGYRRSFSYGAVEIAEDNTLPAGDLLSVADGRMYDYKRGHKKEAKPQGRNAPTPEK